MPSKSVTSFATSLSSTQPEQSLGIFENRKLNVGIAYFSEGNFEQSVYYFKRFLASCERSYPQSDDRTIMAHEKLADAEAMCKEKKSAVFHYRIAITESREKLSNGLLEADYENVLNRRFCRVLVNCGNVFLGLTNEASSEPRRFGAYCENAIECYEEAMPLVQEIHGLSAPPSMELAQRFCTARESLAKHFIEGEKANFAAEQYQETLAMLKPYLSAFDNNNTSNRKEDKYKRYFKLIQFYYFKQAINLGLMYLQQGRLDDVVEVFEDALHQIKLRIDEFDEKDTAKLDALPPAVGKIIATLLHNMGVVCQKKKERKYIKTAIVQYKRVIHVKNKQGTNPGFSILGLAECQFELQDYDNALNNLLKAEEKLDLNNISSYNEAINICFRNIAEIYKNKNDIEKCVIYFYKEIDYLKRSFTDNSELELQKVSETMHRIACVYFEVKYFDDALNTHMETLTYKRKKGDNPSSLSTTLQHIGKIYVLKKNYEMAFDSYSESLEFSGITEKMAIYFEMGEILRKMKCFYEAIDHYESCKKLALEDAIFNVSTIINCVLKLGLLYVTFDEYDKAISEYEATLQLLDEFGIEQGRDRSIILLELGNAHLCLCSLDLAMRYCVESKKMLPGGDPTYYIDLKSCVFSISHVHEKKKEIDQSLSCLSELINVASFSIPDKYKKEVEFVSINYERACIQVRDERYNDAIQTHQDILASKHRAHELATSDDLNFNEYISVTFCDIGDISANIQMYDNALLHYDRALEGVGSVSKVAIFCKIGKVKVAMKKHVEALKHFQEALSLLNGQFHEHRKTSIMVLRHVASFQSKMFRTDEAIDHYEKALLLQNDNYAEETGEVMRCLKKSKYKFDDNDEAIQTFQIQKNQVHIDKLCTTFEEVKIVAREIVEDFARGDDFDSCISFLKSTINLATLFITDIITLRVEVSNSLSQIACIQQQAGKFNDAIQSYKVLLCLKKMMYSGDNADTSRTYHGIAEVYVATGAYQYALNNFREALKQACKEDTIVLLDKMGMVLFKMGHIDGAKDCYNSALLLCENKYIDRRILLFNNLGNINMCTGNLHDALLCYTHAISSITTKQLIKEETKHILLNMGLVYFNKKLFYKSLESFKFYLSERNKDADAKETFFDSNIAYVITYFGIVQLSENNFKEAIEWLQHSIDLLKSNSHRNVQLLIAALSNIGFAYCHLLDFGIALESLAEAIEFAEEFTEIRNERLLSSLYLKSGYAYFRARKYDSSLEEYQRARPIIEKLGNEKERIEIKHNVALVYCKKRRYDDALKLLNEVKARTIKMYGDNHLEVAKVLIDLGNLSRRKRELDNANSQFFRASEILIYLNCPRDHPYHQENHRSINRLRRSTRNLN